MKKVYGNYLTTAEARRAIDELRLEGYEREDIKVIANKELGGNLSYYEEDLEDDDRGLWEKIKDAFTSDDYDEEYWDRDLDNDEKTVLEPYKTNLESGEIIILIEDKLGHQTGRLDEDIEDEKVMELKKEKLNIDKEEVEVGEVDVRKVTRQETQTVEVPVEKEEIIIEKRSAGDREVRDGEKIDTDSFKDGEEIHIPIKEERVNVSKNTVVDDEVVIKKDKRRETETVTEELKREDIEVDGDVEVRDDLDRDELDRDDLDRDKRGI